jgi:hypothetical protein
MRVLPAAIAVAALAFGLSGCVAYDVASTTVGAATSVAGTAVDVTGDVVSGAADTVTGGSDDRHR